MDREGDQYILEKLLLLYNKRKPTDTRYRGEEKDTLINQRNTKIIKYKKKRYVKNVCVHDVLRYPTDSAASCSIGFCTMRHSGHGIFNEGSQYELAGSRKRRGKQRIEE